MGSLSDQERYAGIPQVVEPDPLVEAGSGHGRAEPRAIEPAVTERPRLPTGEQQLFGAAPGQQGGGASPSRSRESDRPGASVLRRDQLNRRTVAETPALDAEA